MLIEDIEICNGKSSPIGASIRNGGVNFSIYVTKASSVELLLFDNKNSIEPSVVIPMNSPENSSYYYRHVFVKGISSGQYYAYRIDGEYNTEKALFFDKSKVLIDPYAKGIFAENYDRSKASIYGLDNLNFAYKSLVVDDTFDWEENLRPNIHFEDLVIYEMHIGGFTKDESSGVSIQNRGKYLGVVEKIPYLKSLGINAVELMPVFAFDKYDAPNGLTNYWGYSPINFFAIHNDYSSDGSPEKAILEFKTMVKELHKAGIEVILDVVYNHTAENNQFGPTLSLKGFAGDSYYILDESNKCFLDYTGCGNTFNSNHSVARRMILDSLNYWVEEMHIDGFRFDLASVLSRNEKGDPVTDSPIIWQIESEPSLARTKLIAEAWDASGLYQVGWFTGEKWAEWNGKYRDDIRRFVRGDQNMVRTIASRIVGSPDIFKKHSFQVSQSIHFISCHDGFTMNDLVSFNEKNNFDNGENNNDGSNDNFSWNCGYEGSTDDIEIEKLRLKQIKNFFSISFLSQGTPMILMGDEFRRSQNGNNNAYCHDSKLNWVDWSLVEKNSELLNFVRSLIQVSNEFEVLRFPKNINTKNKKDGSPYIIWHGVKNKKPDWSDNSHTLGFEYNYPDKKERIIVFMNFFWEDLIFELPKAKNGHWQLRFDTSLEQNSTCSLKMYDDRIDVQNRSVVVLIDK